MGAKVHMKYETLLLNQSKMPFSKGKTHLFFFSGRGEFPFIYEFLEQTLLYGKGSFHHTHHDNVLHSWILTAAVISSLPCFCSINMLL